MATLTPTGVTLVDHAKFFDPSGNVLATAEVLNKTNVILQDAYVMEGNLPTGHRHGVRTGLPSATWRKFYGGVQPTKSTKVTVDDSTGMLEAYSEMDAALANLGGKREMVRNDEDRAHIEGMSQQMATAMFYDDSTVNPERPTGLQPRFNSTSAANGGQIVLAGGSTTLTSIWVVTWGPGACALIYPKGSQAGLQVNDKGLVTVEDASGGSNTGRMEAYRTHFKWDVGLVVSDWRWVARVANIDTTALSDAGESGFDGAQLEFRLIDALSLLPDYFQPAPASDPNAGQMMRPVIYCNRTIYSALHKLARAATTYTLTHDQFGGRPVLTFQGVPIRRCDALTNAETVIT